MTNKAYQPMDYQTLLAKVGPERLREYDPATHDVRIQKKLHTLDLVNARFARQFRSMIFKLLGKTADIAIVGTKYQSYREYDSELPGVMSFNLFSLKPLKGNGMIVYSPETIRVIVDLLFGGTGKPDSRAKDKEFTPNEQNFIRRLAGDALEAYTQAWSTIYKIEPETGRSETQLRFTNITNNAGEILINTVFQMEIGSYTGEFSVIVPIASLEPIRQEITNLRTTTDQEDTGPWKKQFRKEVKQSPVDLRVEYLQLHLTMGDVENFEVGQVFLAQQPTRLKLAAGGIPVFTCDYGRKDGKNALLVETVHDHSLQRLAAQMNAQHEAAEPLMNTTEESTNE
ncbi:flagellar motor switch protein FliM [Pseudomonas aeruginosa]